ncbi:MAG TPA: cation:proton antiporter [Kofleriaceae bacterium]|nr:cation:proton antiporter [Kofleriaceae bacterium]
MLLLLALAGLMHAARSFSTDTTLAGTELAFGFLLLAAYFTSKIVSRVGLPKLTGYLLAGVLAGPYVFGFVTADMMVPLKIVSNTATAIIALEAGSELEIAKVRPVMRTLRAMTIFAVIGAMFVITAVVYLTRPMLGFFEGFDLTQSLAVSAMVGVSLSAQSPAVVMALLSEMRSEGPLTSTVLASVVVADLVVILVFSIATAITSSVIGGGIDVLETVLGVLWELLGSMVFGVALGMLIGQFLLSVKSGASLFALLVCFVVAEIGARIHLDPLIVMLAAGIWLRNFSRADASDLFRNFASAQLPVFLVFFALAGAKLNIYELASMIVPVGLIAIARASSFYIGTKVATTATNAPDVVKKFAWFGLVPQAGLALALAGVIEKSFPSFGDKARVLLIGVVGLNECIAPPILRGMLLRSGEAGKKAGVDFAAGGH